MGWDGHFYTTFDVEVYGVFPDLLGWDEGICISDGKETHVRGICITMERLRERMGDLREAREDM